MGEWRRRAPQRDWKLYENATQASAIGVASGCTPCRSACL